MEIEDLVAEVTLVDIARIQYAVDLKVDPEQSFEKAYEGLEHQGELTIDVNSVSWDERIEVWFRIRVENESFRLLTSFATVYSRESGEVIPEKVKVDFVEKVAIMAAFPYLRADVQSLSAALRLGDITLDVLRLGDFKVNIESLQGPGGDSPSMDA